MKISPLLLSFSLAAGLPLFASNAQADGNQVACDNDKQYLTAGEGRARCPDKAAAAETLSCDPGPDRRRIWNMAAECRDSGAAPPAPPAAPPPAPAAPPKAGAPAPTPPATSPPRPTASTTPAPAPAPAPVGTGPKPGQYVANQSCLGSAQGVNVDATGKSAIGVATCKGALERELKAKLCPANAGKAIPYEYNFADKTKGTAKITCRK